LASVGFGAGTASRGAALVHKVGEVLRLKTGGASSNNSLQATTPAAFTSARCARLRFGLRVLRLSSMPLGVRPRFEAGQDVSVAQSKPRAAARGVKRGRRQGATWPGPCLPSAVNRSSQARVASAHGSAYDTGP
jgi:hypothetical protein